MTFDEYVFIAAVRVRRSQQERVGQAFYNALRYEADRGDLEAQICGGPLDCFNTDHLLPPMLEWLAANWGNEEETA